MRAYVNKNACIFCGMCGGACPDVFFSDYDGRSIALDIELTDEFLVMAKRAEEICPAGAITIMDVPKRI